MRGFRDPNRKLYLYTLVDPFDESVRYVGVTIDPCLRRLNHISAAVKRNGQSEKDKWIQRLHEQGTAPILRIIRTCSESDRFRVEERYVVKMRDAGHRLFNNGNRECVVLRKVHKVHGLLPWRVSSNLTPHEWNIEQAYSYLYRRDSQEPTMEKLASFYGTSIQDVSATLRSAEARGFSLKAIGKYVAKREEIRNARTS